MSLLCLALVLLLFVGRLLQLQGVDAPAYAEQAADVRTHSVTLPAERGAITDDHGVVLATSVEAYDITADQTEIEDPATRSRPSWHPCSGSASPP